MVSQDGPVFLLTLHRAGGTVLARVLNSHPGIVIWGEHIGLINRLAEIDDMVTRVGRMMASKTDEAIAEYVVFPEHRLTEFDPWANPFDYDAFIRSCREMVQSIFTRGLQAGQRWGFKEIRYHRVLTVRFLEKLFPGAQFIILRRDIRDVAVSAILAHWSLRWLDNYREAMSVEVADAIVCDVTYAILAIESGLHAVQEHLGPHCLRLDYGQLMDASLSFVKPLFGFLELALSDEVITRINNALKVRAGATDQETCFGGILSGDFIRSRVTEVAPACARTLLATASTERDWSRGRELDNTPIWQVTTPCVIAAPSSPVCFERVIPILSATRGELFDARNLVPSRALPPTAPCTSLADLPR